MSRKSGQDQTVPPYSAKLSGVSDYKITRGVPEHSGLCANENVRQKIIDILTGSTSATNSHPSLSNEDPEDSIGTTHLEIKSFSLAKLHAYDIFNRHTGALNDTSWEELIPGSRYIPGDPTSSLAPQVLILPKGQTYTIRLDSSGAVDTISVIFDNVDGGKLSTGAFYDSISLLSSGVVTGTIDSSSKLLELSVDKDGDSVIDEIKSASSLVINDRKLERWNLVSVPVFLLLLDKDSLYPSAISDAFEYSSSSGYVVRKTLDLRKGYWIKFDSSFFCLMIGTPRWSDTIEVKVGWNMIGAISTQILASSIVSDPPGLVTSNFFGYDGQYVIADTIFPGKGYWVKVNQAGKLILSSATQSLSKARIKIVPTSEMPPSPPSDITGQMELPKEYRLEQNYPNPLNPSTTLKYSLPVDSRVTLKIYNTLGQIVRVLSDDVQSAGYKSVMWTATDLASAVYFYRLEATSVSDPNKTFRQVKKMLLLK